MSYPLQLQRTDLSHSTQHNTQSLVVTLNTTNTTLCRMSDNGDHEESEEERSESEFMGDDDSGEIIGKAAQCTFGIRWNRSEFPLQCVACS
jgi:hypothetical protein